MSRQTVNNDSWTQFTLVTMKVPSSFVEGHRGTKSEVEVFLDQTDDTQSRTLLKVLLLSYRGSKV